MLGAIAACTLLKYVRSTYFNIGPALAGPGPGVDNPWSGSFAPLQRLPT
jgi:hypothetical protein